MGNPASILADFMVNSLQNHKILEVAKLKAFADKKNTCC